MRRPVHRTGFAKYVLSVCLMVRQRQIELSCPCSKVKLKSKMKSDVQCGPAGWTVIRNGMLLLVGICLCGCATTRSTPARDYPHPTSEVKTSDPPAGKSGWEQLPFPGVRRRVEATNITAHVVAYRDYRDPLAGFNRVMFVVNDRLYRYLLIPVSDGYRWLFPDPVERSVGNFFHNVKTPGYALNHLLQWRLKPLGRNILRFGINSTVGLLGLFDPAQSWFDLERSETHLEDTIARYGLGYGIYLVLPVFGPSDIRNAVSLGGEYFINPFTYLAEFPVSTGIKSFDYMQDFAPRADQYNVLRRESDDPYIFFRNLYLQGVQRDADY